MPSSEFYLPLCWGVGSVGESCLPILSWEQVTSRGAEEHWKDWTCMGNFPKSTEKEGRSVYVDYKLLKSVPGVLMSSWHSGLQENTKNHLSLGDLRGRRGSEKCPRWARQACSQQTQLFMFQEKGNWWNPSAEEERFYIVNKSHGSASLQTTQILCGYLTSLCGFLLMDLTPMYQHSHRGDALFPGCSSVFPLL